MTQHSGGSKNSNEDSNGNRTPDPDANEKSDGNDISVDNIKEEKAGKVSLYRLWKTFPK